MNKSNFLTELKANWKAHALGIVGGLGVFAAAAAIKLEYDQPADLSTTTTTITTAQPE